MNHAFVLETKTTRTSPLVFAWAAILLVSLLPDIFFREFTGSLPARLEEVKAILAGGLLLASLFWKPLQALRLFFTALLAILLVQWSVGWTYQGLGYETWFAGQSPFLKEMVSVQLPRTSTALLVILVMLSLTRSFDRFFFVKGKLDAPAEPIPFLLTRPPSWRILGPAIAGAMCLGLVAFTLVFGNLAAFGTLKAVLPLLPFVLLFAASNALGEEMIYRAPLLGALESPVGPAQALLMTTAYFGISHFYGVPYGILGVIMAFIPGWLMGKAMLETRGFFWAWFIHFCMDVVIFFFIALGSIRPGG